VSAGNDTHLDPNQESQPVKAPLVNMHTERALRQITRRQQQEEDRSILRLAEYFNPH
jgi:hypothetical protein